MERLRHTDLLNVDSEIAFSEIYKTHAMLSHQDMVLYYYLAKFVYAGNGNIVDAGVLLGGTTTCFSMGLKENKQYTKDKTLIVYDLLRDEIDGYNSNYLQNRFPEGDFQIEDGFIDFEKIFLNNISSFQQDINIKIHKGDFLTYHEYTYSNPIEILSIDIAKSEELMLHVCHTFFPFLIPGESLVLLQDWVTASLPFLHIGMYALGEHFEDYYECPGGYTKVFKCKKRITKEDIDRKLGSDPKDFYKLSNARYIEMAIEDAISLHNKTGIEGALATFYLRAGKRNTARQHFMDLVIQNDLSYEAMTSYPLSEVYNIFKDEVINYPRFSSKFKDKGLSNPEIDEARRDKDSAKLRMGRKTKWAFKFPGFNFLKDIFN